MLQNVPIDEVSAVAKTRKRRMKNRCCCLNCCRIKNKIKNKIANLIWQYISYLIFVLEFPIVSLNIVKSKFKSTLLTFLNTFSSYLTKFNVLHSDENIICILLSDMVHRFGTNLKVKY